MVRLVKTAHLSCVKISTISKQTQTSFNFSLVTLESHRMRLKWFLSQWYIRRKPCTYIGPTVTLSPNRSKRDSAWPSHLWVPSGASKMIFEPMVHSTQTNSNKLSLELVTLEYRRVRLKRFLSLWYVRRKSCPYVTLTLTLSPNRPNWDSTWPTHLGVPSSASKTISMPMVRSMRTAHLSCVKISNISKRTQTSFQLSLVT
jgi:hypothetical protein